MIKVHI